MRSLRTCRPRSTSSNSIELADRIKGGDRASRSPLLFVPITTRPSLQLAGRSDGDALDAAADIGTVDVIFVSENDDKLNPAGVKGIGELGNVGTNAAISNAVFHATGKRIRNLPIRLEDLLDV